MRRVTLSWAVSILILIFASTASASLRQFSGSWKNTNANTRGVTTLNIRVIGTNVTVQAWGQCQPQDCDWGRVTAYAYAPGVSSNLATNAQAISAVFRTGFSQTLVLLQVSAGNRLRAEVLTRFTDKSGRTNYRQLYTFSRATQATRPRQLPAPPQLSPTQGTAFSRYPRGMTLAWRPVSGARSYTVEIDCYQCCEANKWCAEVGRVWKVQSRLNNTNYTFTFVGAQPGRWRVWAVDAAGRPGRKSPWWGFRFTR